MEQYSPSPSGAAFLPLGLNPGPPRPAPGHLLPKLQATLWIGVGLPGRLPDMGGGGLILRPKPQCTKVLGWAVQTPPCSLTRNTAVLAFPAASPSWEALSLKLICFGLTAVLQSSWEHTPSGQWSGNRGASYETQ